MPELEIQPRAHRGIPGWVWLVGLVLLALIIWWVVEAADTDRELAAVAPTERVAGVQEEVGWNRPLPIQSILVDTGTYFDKEVHGVGNVIEVVSDRGFWLEENGQRLFVVLGEGVTEAGVNIEDGQRVFVHGTLLRGGQAGDAAQLQGDVEADARQIIAAQPIFMRAMAVDILQRRNQ